MPDAFALAMPRKKFFLEMFTRDISLQDCILDLIDNSIDGLIRQRHLELDANHLLGLATAPPDQATQQAKIEISYTKDRFTISDDCGGITRDQAINDVFNFGHITTAPTDNPQLGAYGIGLKRAIFKIGDHFEMRSRTAAEGFVTRVDVNAWSERDQLLEDWRFPMEFIPGATAPDAPGTSITVTKINEDIQALLADRTIESALHRAIAQTYAPFLAHHATVVLNNQAVAPSPIPLGSSTIYAPGVDTWEEDGVRISLIAGLAARGESNEWRAEPAGWYVLCNGRVILAADKTELTGWGAGILPQFHSSKSRGFIGIASFSSKEPLKLPWTTTKRSLNREAKVFLRVRDRMATVARPVYSFLDSLYQSKADVTPEERRVMTSISQATAATVSTANHEFAIKRAPRRPKTTVKVQYDAEIADVDLVGQHLRRPGMSATSVGLYTFQHFLKQEGLR